MYVSIDVAVNKDSLGDCFLNHIVKNIQLIHCTVYNTANSCTCLMLYKNQLHHIYHIHVCNIVLGYKYLLLYAYYDRSLLCFLSFPLMLQTFTMFTQCKESYYTTGYQVSHYIFYQLGNSNLDTSIIFVDHTDVSNLNTHVTLIYFTNDRVLTF